MLEEKQRLLNTVSTWDCLTLYTSLPHAKLKLQLHNLLKRFYTTRRKNFIITNNYHTPWPNDKKSTKYTTCNFPCREFCLTVDFLIIRQNWNSRPGYYPQFNRGLLSGKKIGHGDSSDTFHIGVYDKREDFDFRSVNSPGFHGQ